MHLQSTQLGCNGGYGKSMANQWPTLLPIKFPAVVAMFLVFSFDATPPTSNHTKLRTLSPAKF